MTSRRRRLGLGCGALVFVLALVVLVFGRRLLFPRHFDVVSITSAPEYQDSARLSAAFALPVAAKYQGGPVISQPNGSFCGPTSIANVLRSYGDANATPDTVLSGTGKCSLGICMGGLTLDELADVMRHATGKTVSVLRNLTRADFAGHLMRANDPARRYVVNFDRGPLFGTEGGHHSPIAGYVAEGDLVLVLDVNERYHPWLVKADRLYEAMRTVDASSGLERGLLLVE